MFKKSKLSLTLFIIASLATFVILGICYLLLGVNNINYQVEPIYSSSNKYYLNNNYSEGDPFITKRPSLREMLAGPIITDFDPGMGDRSAPITIVEFSDFECSYCYEQEPVLKKIMAAYKNKIRLIWKDYPVSDQNSISFQAAIAARCADEQGKFWAYHDFLFDNNKSLNSETYYEIANLLDLNIASFKKCLNSEKVRNLILDNIEEANALDINGVPFIYINDQEVMGEISLGELERMVEIELSKMQN